jgi:ADP-heptose:LPS heptosyltransferase
MKEIAIISLTRFGDLIQETPLLRILKRTWPEARITLVAEQRFAGILPLVRGYDRVVTFAKEEVADKAVFAEDPLVPYFFMEGFVRQLEEIHFDLVINLTFSHMSAFLVSLMNRDKSAGLIAGTKGERLISSPWGVYLFATQEGNNRLMNRINLVDLFTGLGGVTPDGKPVELFATEKGEAFADAFLREKGLSGERLIGLQMGASDPIRCWPPESFARLSDLLQERLGVRTILFGSANEDGLATQALSRMRVPAISAVGGTSIEGLYSLLRRCSLLVTNDTGTMHFAAAGGVPSLMLCIGPAFFHGTGPYSAGNLALQADIPCAPCRYNFNCPAPVCRDMLTTKAVFGACRAMLKGEPHLAEEGVKAFRSYFDAEGYLDWQRCDGGDCDEELGKRYVRMWKGSLNHGLLPPPFTDMVESSAPELVRMAAEGILISSRIAAAASQDPLPLDELGALGAAETALAARLKIFSALHPENAPLIDFFSLMRDNITSEELPVIAEETQRCYEWARYLAFCLQPAFPR